MTVTISSIEMEPLHGKKIILVFCTFIDVLVLSRITTKAELSEIFFSTDLISLAHTHVKLPLL